MKRATALGCLFKTLYVTHPATWRAAHIFLLVASTTRPAAPCHWFAKAACSPPTAHASSACQLSASSIGPSGATPTSIVDAAATLLPNRVAIAMLSWRTSMCERHPMPTQCTCTTMNEWPTPLQWHVTHAVCCAPCSLCHMVMLALPKAFCCQSCVLVTASMATADLYAALMPHAHWHPDAMIPHAHALIL